ncbi:MAG: glutathione S-transferase family protein [Rhodospirillales bacterium]
MTDYCLYGRRGVGSCAPELLLVEMGQSYRFVTVTAEESKEAAYLKLCPTGMVPALTLPSGETLFESTAICIHLTLAHPEAGLAPTPGSPAHGRFLQWMLYLQADLYGAYRRVYQTRTHTDGGEAELALVRSRGQADVDRAYRILDGALAETTAAGPGLLGTITAADHYLLMLMKWYSPSFAALLKAYPRLAALAEALRARPQLATALAENGF